ncbi:MAG TPA: AbrB/MazE/SpoVT family DNA-binding domain-containing protein [Anaerolineae bacterium]|jgi:AbrB family looped-hinge helix DNA binding protein|nr:AbrB/MazE/SpoVT family DNA-binding domain-containing protein [Anaerolineae bacterium]
MHEKSFLGAATVGERGQVAIPAEARRALGIKPSGKLLFFTAPNSVGLLMVKAEELSRVVEHLTNKAQTFEQILNRVKED